MPEKKANTPAPAQKAEPASEKLTFAVLAALPIGDLATHLKKIVRVDQAIAKAKDAFTTSLQFNAKCVAALKRAYVDRLNKREIPPDTTFKKYFEQNAGGSLPGRVEALAALFNALVLTVDANGKPLLSEEHFDAAAVDWLEKSNAIIKKAQKTHGDAWKTCDEVLDVVNALSKPGDALKKLKEIRKRLDGDKAESETNETVPLTVAMAIEFLKSAIKAAGKLPEADGYELYAATFSLSDAWGESGLPDDTLNEWAEKYERSTGLGVPPTVEVITESEEPKGETPDQNPVPDESQLVTF
jgi:hypothetical protein